MKDYEKETDEMLKEAKAMLVRMDRTIFSSQKTIDSFSDEFRLHVNGWYGIDEE